METDAEPIPIHSMSVDDLRLKLAEVDEQLTIAYANKDGASVTKLFRKKPLIERRIELLEKAGPTDAEQQLREPMNIGTESEPFIVRKFVATILKSAIGSSSETQVVRI